MLYERTAISKKPEETIKNDLLFCHRGLNRLVVIDLKIGKFKPADKGQIELYLRYLEKNEMRPGENKPIALILCADKSEEAVKLMGLDEGDIRIAQYLIKTPPKEEFEKRPAQAIANAKKSFYDLRVPRSTEADH